MPCLLPVSGAVRRSRLHCGVLLAVFHQHSERFRRQHRPKAPVRTLILMNASGRAITASSVLTLPVHALLILSCGMVSLALLVYIGIVLPTIWSTKPTLRNAVAAVLRQVLDAWTGPNRR
jgi:hypothetical protein